MKKTFFILALLAIPLGIAVWLMQNSASVEVRGFGYHLTFSLSGFFLIMTGVFLLLKVVFFLMFSPIKLWQAYKHRNEKAAVDFLMQAAISLIEKDSKGFESSFKKAKPYFEKRALFSYFEAQKSLLSGDRLEAEMGFERLLRDKETESVGYLALAQLALQHGEKERAFTFYQRAKERGDLSPVLEELVFDLALDLGSYEAAFQAARRVSRDKGRLLQARAYEKRFDACAEAEDAFEAYRLSPTLKRAEDVAQCLHKQKETRKLIRHIESTWRFFQSMTLAKFYRKAKDLQSPLDFFQALVKLPQEGEVSEVSFSILIQTALDAQLWGEAKSLLKKGKDLYPKSLEISRLEQDLKKLDQF